MPLQENPNLAKKNKTVRHSKSFNAASQGTNILHVMKTRSRAFVNAPTDLRLRKSHDSFTEAPKLVVNDVESSLNMAQVNGLFKEQNHSPPDGSRPGRVISASMMRSGTISISYARLAAERTDMRTAAFSTTEPVTTSEPAWSSAVGHASTGKSGRVIEKLQAEIDRLRRENHLIKVQFDEVEKANETLATRNQYLHDRNSNYEASHEANIRQLDRKERQVQDLREELKREKEKCTRAEQRASVAATNEETWKDRAGQAQAIAQQKEVEYDTIVACRTMDNDRYQGGLDKIRANLSTLVQQREEDTEKHKKLQIIAEQQRATIHQLEQLTQKLNANFRSYRSEIDSAIEELQESTGSNDAAVSNKLREMEKVTGQMKWIINVEQVLNHKQHPPQSCSEQTGHSNETITRGQVYSDTSHRAANSIDMKGKQGRKKFGKGSKS